MPIFGDTRSLLDKNSEELAGMGLGNLQASLARLQHKPIAIHNLIVKHDDTYNYKATRLPPWN